MMRAMWWMNAVTAVLRYVAALAWVATAVAVLWWAALGMPAQ
jgi:hypothetical protein